MRRIALEIPLRALARGRRRQRGHAAYARIQALRDALDDAALAGGIAALEQHDQAMAGVHHPVLQLDQLALQAQQFAEIALAIGAPVFVGSVFAVQPAIVQFQLQLFIQAVDQIRLQAQLPFQRGHAVAFECVFHVAPWRAGRAVVFRHMPDPPDSGR